MQGPIFAGYIVILSAFGILGITFAAFGLFERPWSRKKNIFYLVASAISSACFAVLLPGLWK